MVASRPSTGLVALVIAACAVVSGGARVSSARALGMVLAIVAAHNMAVFGSLQGGYAGVHRTHAEHHGCRQPGEGRWSPGWPGCS